MSFSRFKITTLYCKKNLVYMTKTNLSNLKLAWIDYKLFTFFGINKNLNVNICYHNLCLQNAIKQTLVECKKLDKTNIEILKIVLAEKPLSLFNIYLYTTELQIQWAKSLVSNSLGKNC